MESAQFRDRKACISCTSQELNEIASGKFWDEPLRSFIEDDPFGEHPLPFLVEAHWRFVACTNCGQMFHQRVLTPAWAERYYTKWMTAEAIAEFEARHRVSDSVKIQFDRGRQHVAHVLRIERLTRPLRSSAAVRILDFGCGWGEFLSVAEHFGFDCYGIDRSSERRREGRVRIMPDIDAIRSEKAQPFDAITLFQVLEHLEEPLGVLKSLAELMKPGGILVLETPDCTGVGGIRNAREYRLIGPLSHINAYTPASLTAIAARARFRLVRKPAAHVTTELMRVAKGELAAYIKPKPTQQYFVYEP